MGCVWRLPAILLRYRWWLFSLQCVVGSEGRDFKWTRGWWLGFHKKRRTTRSIDDDDDYKANNKGRAKLSTYTSNMLDRFTKYQ